MSSHHVYDPQTGRQAKVTMSVRMSAETRATIRALIPIYSITLVDVFGYMIMIPLLPYLAQKYGASGLLVGALLAIMAVASTIAAPLWGALSDKLGRKPIVTISQVISLIGYLLVAWAPSLGMLFVARTVAGIGGGNLGVTQSYISDVTDDRHRDKAFAAFGVVFGIGIVLGPIAGGILVKYGFWVPFVSSAAIEAVNIGLTLMFLPKTKHNLARAWPGTCSRHVSRIRVFIMMIHCISGILPRLSEPGCLIAALDGAAARYPQSSQKWIDRPPWRPPKIRGYQGNGLSTAGDIAIPARMESPP
ncbi:MAG: MFS transporter [Candidatus Cybelea sp.]